MSNETIRVMLVDDHALIREGLRVLLRRASDIIVIGEAGDGVEALDLVTRLLPDVVVLDLGMPRSDGATALAGLHRVVPQVHVLILTMYDEGDRLVAAAPSRRQWIHHEGRRIAGADRRHSGRGIRRCVCASDRRSSARLGTESSGRDGDST